jgi:NAD(P)-dependent dehydrogenase (short-subunit alcohol dehydrogenase family)
MLAHAFGTTMSDQQQKPLGSGFGSRTTAAQVLSGLDLAGKRAIVTGGHSGLGLETTKAIAGAGVEVIVASRNPESARAATDGIAGASVEALDLSSLDSVRAFVERILASGRHIDMLINNAGIMACPETRVGPRWEAQFATNHLGHFALTNLLWPALKGGARVVSVSSAGHHLSAIRWDDVQFEHDYDKWLAYAQAKTANALFAVHLDRLGRSARVRAFSLHPGKILTPLQRYLTQGEMIGVGWLDASGAPADPTFKTWKQGAATAVWAATSPQLDGLGGLYCEDCDVAGLAESDDGLMVGVRDYAVDPDQAARLWRLSAELAGVDAFQNAVSSA